MPRIMSGTQPSAATVSASSRAPMPRSSHVITSRSLIDVSLSSAAVSASIASAMSSSLESSSGWCETPPFSERTKSIDAFGTNIASWPAPETSRGASGSTAANASPIGTGSERHATSKPIASISWSRSAASAERASTPTVTRSGTTFIAFGSTSIAPTVATVPFTAHSRTCSTKLRRVDERVGARVHRRRAGMVGAALEDTLAARLPCDRRHDAERLVEAREHRPLLDVHLEVRVGRRLDPLASHRPRLLGAERDDGERTVAQPVGRLDRRDDAEHAVEAAGGRNAVEVRAGPHARVAARPEEVPGAVARDLEPGVAHPAGGELVRRILLGRVRRAVLRDRVDRVDALEARAHAAQCSQDCASPSKRERGDGEEAPRPRSSLRRARRRGPG